MESHEPTSDRKQRHANIHLEKIGTLSLLVLLEKFHLPAMEIPRENDFGIDILTDYVEESYRNLARPQGWNDRDRSKYLERWIIGTLGAAGAGERVDLPTGHFLAFQVKTSRDFQPDEPWKRQLDVGNVLYWQSTRIPVYIVFSDTSGNLRYCSADSLSTPKSGAASVTATLTEVLDESSLKLILDSSRVNAVQERALGISRRVFQSDQYRQYEGTAATAVCFISYPETCKALVRSLPYLSGRGIFGAIRSIAIVAAFIRDFTRELNRTLNYGSSWPTNQSDNEAGHTEIEEFIRELRLSLGLDELRDLPARVWVTLLQGFEPSPVHYINSEFVDINESSSAAVPHDPDPTLEFDGGILDTWVADAFRKVAGRFTNIELDELMLLVVAGDPVSIACAAAKSDLGPGGSGKHNVGWWAHLVAQSVIAHAHYRGESPSSERNSLSIIESFAEFEREIPASLETSGYAAIKATYVD